jgi:rRNA-processing protein FCF1
MLKKIMKNKITKLLKNKAKLIVDTNAFLLMGSKGIDVLTEAEELITEPVEAVVIDNTLKELLKIAEGRTFAKGKDKFNAKLGFIFIKQKGLKIIKSKKEDKLVDDTIVRIADETTYVVTLDKELQKRLKEKQSKIITLRQKRLTFLER